MKKIILCLCAALLMLQSVCIAAQKRPIYADELNDGEYPITVTSSSSMFRIADCTLTIAGGKMRAAMTLSGKGYEKLFMGTGAEASAAPDSECIYFTENSGGKYTYTVPVEALDTEIDCAAWSIKKQKWYDRTLVFESSGLPKNAFGRKAAIPAAIAAAAAVIAVLAAVIFIWKRKRSNES